MRPSFLERFWTKVNYEVGSDQCWLWTASCHPLGYGQFNIGRGRMAIAHRIAYELLVGPIPEGMTLDHLCRNPPCVNPAHLEPVTQRENVLRGVGPTAQHARATHCPKGHAFDGTKNHGGRRLPSRICTRCEREKRIERTARDRLARQAAREAA